MFDVAIYLLNDIYVYVCTYRNDDFTNINSRRNGLSIAAIDLSIYLFFYVYQSIFQSTICDHEKTCS